ncbi:hypothetical protein IWQ60_007939 [Tieghemiomyces parasiticus]|uniref:DUF2470 domain-containing protein n=1 Tax=Tieghemiomyces parasiticus TaxID=78921 RepID=A0A9W8DSK1_9FUNG|nr:hypothetical protein IWQ60_007939 [Tieghemiomyces parasiticus]
MPRSRRQPTSPTDRPGRGADSSVDPIAANASHLLPALNQRYEPTLAVLCRYYGKAALVSAPRIVDISAGGCVLAYREAVPGPAPAMPPIKTAAQSPPSSVSASAAENPSLAGDLDTRPHDGQDPLVGDHQEPHKINIAFKRRLHDEKELGQAFNELFDEARVGIVTHQLNRVPADKMIPFRMPNLTVLTVMGLSITLMLYLLWSAAPVYPLNLLQDYVTPRIIHACAVFALAVHIFEASAAAMTCTVVGLLAPGYLPKSVGAKYIVGTFLFGFPFLRNLIGAVKDSLQDEETE